MFEANGNFVFFLLAGIVQIALGFTFLFRHSDQKWKLPAGFLFLLNGGISIAGAINSGYPSGARESEIMESLQYLLDPLTSYVILFLALGYPKPIRGFEGKTWLLGILVGIPATAHFLSGLLVPGLLEGLYDRGSATWAQSVYVSSIQEVAWTVVLLRWSFIIAKSKQHWQFCLLASALAVRASHVGIVAFGTRVNWVSNADKSFWDLLPPVQYHLVISVLPLLALLAAFVLLQLQQPSRDARTANLFTGVLVLGAVEAMFSMASLAGISWTRAPFLYLDLLLLRPVLIWGSLYGYPRGHTQKVVGAVAFVILCTAAFIPASRSALLQMDVDNSAAWFFSLFFTLMMTGLAMRFVFPLLRPRTWGQGAPEETALQA